MTRNDLIASLKRRLKTTRLGFAAINLRKRIKTQRLASILKNQLRLKSETTYSCEQGLYNGKNVLVPILEVSHYQIHHILLLAKALQLRGASIKVLVCNSFLPACEIKSSRNRLDPDPCFNCKLGITQLLPLYGLDTISLDELIGPDFNSIDFWKDLYVKYPEASFADFRFIYDSIDYTSALRDSVVRYFYGDCPEITDAEFLNVLQANVEAVLASHEASKAISQRWNPDVVLTNMVSYSLHSPFFKLFSKGTSSNVVTISLSSHDRHTIRFNDFDIYTRPFRYNHYVDSRPHPNLDDHERRELGKYMVNWQNGKIGASSSHGFFDNDCLSIDAVKSILNYNQEQRNIFMFPNIFWDIGLDKCGALYPDVISWVLDTIRLVSEYPSITLYIKPHPGEIKSDTPSSKTILDFILETYPVGFPNVRIIPPDLSIKTSDLYSLVDLGLIFNGTVGLEMALEGIPVIATGACPWSGCNVNHEPSTIDEYKLLLYNEHTKSCGNLLDAELFAYFYFVKSAIPLSFCKIVYGDYPFSGFRISSLDQILPGNDKYLDHLCKCIVSPQDSVTPEVM